MALDQILQTSDVAVSMVLSLELHLPLGAKKRPRPLNDQFGVMLLSAVLVVG